ncbi:MAG: alpha/beta fold hydrolase [Acidimicrobiia bacterium]|nr:alpha/beta fold hydrolase [Acidimicrobiia bacterium]
MTTNEPPNQGQPGEPTPPPPSIPQPIPQPIPPADAAPTYGVTPAGAEPMRPSDMIEQAQAAAVAGDPEGDGDGDNRTAIFAGVATGVIVLAALAFFIFSNRSEPVAAPPNLGSQTPLTTLSGATPTSSSTLPGDRGYQPRLEGGRCPFDLTTDGEFEFDCGWMVVPEDRQNVGNRREVRIPYARFTSTNPDAPADPIIYLDGGPGGSTLDTLQFSFGPVWSKLVENRDLIMFDQRGVGLAEPSLDCPEERQWLFSVLDEQLTLEEERTAELEVIGQCRDRLVEDGVDLAQYNSVENAADVNDLRFALGYEKVNLLGISYGTRLATTVMRDFPEGIRSVVLDSTYTPDVNLTVEAPANFDRALAELFEGCAQDTPCAERYPDLEERLFALYERYEASPVEAPVRDFINGGSWDVLFDGDWLLGTVFQGLYSEAVIPVLPQLVEELEAGDTSTLSLLTSNTLANANFISLGMMLSVQCNEEISFTTQAEIDAGLQGLDDIAPIFDGASNVGDFMLEACDVWQAGTAAPNANEPVESDLPTLVLAGEYDPITPPAWGASASAYLSNSTYVEFPGLGHGTSISGGCPLDITFAFIDDPTGTVDTSCVATMKPIDFKIPGEPAPPIELVEFSEDVFGTEVSGVVPDGWESVGFGGYARGESGIDQTAILQQFAPFAAPDTFVSLLASQFGISGSPDRIDTVESDVGTWTIYNGTADGFEFDMAVVEIGQSTGLVALISNPEERQQLYDEVLLPAIAAFRVQT